MSSELKFYRVEDFVVVGIDENNFDEVKALLNKVAPNVKWRMGDELVNDKRSGFGYNPYRDMSVYTVVVGVAYSKGEPVLLGDYDIDNDDREEATFEEFIHSRTNID